MIEDDGYPFFEMRSTCASIEDIVDYITNNVNLFYDNYFNQRYFEKYNTDRCPSLEVSLGNTLFRRRGNIPNTHNCPFGGVTNFYRRDDLPKTYKGHEFSLNVRSDEKLKVHWEIFSNTGIWTGTSSGSETSFRTSICIFHDDWPLLKAMYELENKL